MTQTKFKRLFLDIETSPCIVYSWGTGYNLTLPHDNIITERAIICACWKWEGERGVSSAIWNSQHDDAWLLKNLIHRLNQADEIVAHNGSHFDLPWIRTRALKHGIPCNWNFKVFDTLVEARRRLYLNSNSLDYISKFLDRKGKTKTDFSWWIDVMNDKPGALDRMVRYCKRDVRELEAVFHRISTHLGHKTHRGVQEGGSKWQCPLCGSAKVSPHKPRTTAAGTIQHQMQCGKCHKYYTISAASYEKMLEEEKTP